MRPPTEMELRAVKAALDDIEKNCGGHCYVGDRDAQMVVIDADVDVKSMVRAVIRAMREPTPGMMDIFMTTVRWRIANKATARDGYIAMIDAASPPEETHRHEWKRVGNNCYYTFPGKYDYACDCGAKDVLTEDQARRREDE